MLALGGGYAGPPAAAQTTLSAFGRASLVAYRVDAGDGVQRFSGASVGAEGVLERGSRFELRVAALSGVLATDAAGEPDRTVGEVGASVRFFAARWLAFEAGAVARSYATSLARQRWVLTTLGVEARPRFTGGALCGILRAAAMPAVSVNDLPRPDLALAAGAGLGYRRDRLSLEAAYALERYDFPPKGSLARAEQLATFTLRAGIRVRAWPR